MTPYDSGKKKLPLNWMKPPAEPWSARGRWLALVGEGEDGAKGMRQVKQHSVEDKSEEETHNTSVHSLDLLQHH